LLKERKFTDEELLDSLTTGDPVALQELIGMYFPILCKFAEKFLPDSSLAKDVVQETFIKFWNARQPFGSLAALKGFLFVATKNGSLNLNRGRERQENRHQEVYGRGSDTIDPFLALTEMVYSENIALVYKTVRTLPRPMQEIFYLSYEEGLTVKEISARLNMKLKTVKNHKYKTLLVLRSRFGNQRGPLLLFLSLLLK
jgi:RNA polymerase sigma factor (sigma-70 family)